MSTATAGGAAEAAETSEGGYRAALGAEGAAGGFDEMLGPAGGAPRDAWKPLLSVLADTPDAELRRRWERARLMIADHGVTYRAYGDRQGEERPWRLDPVPVVVGPGDWADLEAGLLQRARLLEAVLADLHGPRRLVEEGVVPARLVLGNPGFLRPLQGFKPAGGRWLSVLATDLARDAGGRWVVLGDRSAAPGGVGHALEHRTVVSRTLPAAFRRSRVRGLGAWFDAVRAHAEALSPRGGQPRVVLLTPGPAAAGHAEHAYLARGLGFTLVEPADLTVRRKAVYLKTLGGLERVDVVVRRTTDADTDPLEFGGAGGGAGAGTGGGGGGVPGLLQAQRAGAVAVTNAPGSGLVESPGLLAYLPGACRLLLNEGLLLPATPTAWAAEGPLPADLSDAVVKPAHAGPLTPGVGPGAAVFGAGLGEREAARLRAAAAERPDAFVAQRSVPLSTTPAWGGGAGSGPGDRSAPGAVRLEPRRLVLRAFTAAVAGGHAVMPGGLGRVTPGAASRLTSMRRGGGAKDVWVVAAGGEAAAGGPAGPAGPGGPGGADGPAADRGGFAPPAGPVRGAAAAGGAAGSAPGGGGHLPSRVADNLFWLGRYAERAEGTVRLLRAIGHRCEDPAEAHPREMGTLLRALSVVTGVAEAAAPAGAASPASPPAPAPAPAAGDVLAAIFDPQSPHGLARTLGACRRAGSLVRDRLSVDAWRILERLGRDFAGHGPGRGLARADAEDALADAMELFDGMLLTLAAFAGHAHESFTHEEGWRFLDTGRRIERAVFLAELTRALLVRPVWGPGPGGAGPGGAAAPAAASLGGPARAGASEGLLLSALLEVGVSAMTYRARHPALPRVVPVLGLLLFDGSNPRSLRWQLDAIRRHLHGLPDAGGRPGEAEAAAAADRLVALLDATTPEELALVTGGARAGLDRLLGAVVEGLPALSDDVSRAYVRLTP